MRLRRNVAVALALTAGVFSVDFFTPVGYADFLLYIIPLIVAAPVLKSSQILSLAVVYTILIGSSYFISPRGGDPIIASVNRGVAALVIWATSLIIIRRKKVEAALDRSCKDLELADLKLREEIAQRKVAESELKESQDTYRTIIETATEGICVVDDTYTITFVNPKMAELIGYSEKKLKGKNLTDLMFDEDIAQFRNHAESREKGSAEQYEFRFRHKNGRELWMMISATPLMDMDGKFRGSFAMLTDITGRKEAERELGKLYAELEQRIRERTAELENAYKEMESFGYAISHDLKAPLRRIIGFSDMFATDYQNRLDDQGKQLLRKIGENAKSMENLIGDLLEYSRIGCQSLNPTEISMDGLVRSAYEELQVDIRDRNIDVQISELPSAYCDPVLMRQVLLNLFSNAFKFTRDRETAHIEVGSRVDQHEAVFYVRDNGTGFDMQLRGRLFGLFQRIHSDKEYEGTGVGLVIVKKIIEKHGGRVWAEGKPDEGATFYFSLPLKDA